MNRKTPLLKILMTLFITALCACAGQESLTLSGFPYKIIKKTGSEPARKGEYVYYYVNTIIADTLVFTSRDTNTPQIYEMQEDSVLIRTQSPYLEVLKYLGTGDSAIVTQSLEGIRKLPPEFGDAKEVAFSVFVEKIFTREEYEKDLQEQRLRTQEKKDTYAAQINYARNLMEEFFQLPVTSRFEGFSITESGLRYKFIEQGNPNKRAETGIHMVDLSYYGCFSDGKLLETSYKYGIPHRFVLGSQNIMPGWNEVIELMPHGSSVIAYIPAHLAYGNTGFKGNIQIPPNEDLFFYFKIEEIIPVRKF